MSLKVIILAAGEGTRLKSKTPKVLHTLAGKPLLQHVIEAAEQLNPQDIFVVVNHQADKVKKYFSSASVTWVPQAELLGTADAVKQVLPHLKNDDRVIVLYGDVPLLTPKTLNTLVDVAGDSKVALVTVILSDPGVYGRIVRNESGAVVGIVEAKDACAKDLEIQEINAGIYLFPADFLHRCLPSIKSSDVSGEYYLTNVIAEAVREKIDVVSVRPDDVHEVKGVNTRAQLAELERYFQRKQAQYLMDQGVTLLDPNRFDLRGVCQVERDICIDTNVILEGDVSIGENTHIGSQVFLRNVCIGKGVEIKAFCHIENAIIEDGCVVGPFARIRPGTTLKKNARVGNFVEIKKSTIGQGSKINHLSYVGDADIGKNVNVGAGTITCNYDGVKKHKTTIEDGAFIGSNAALVAPITVGKCAVVGAGSTLTSNVPSGSLAVSRVKQKTFLDWVRLGKKK